MKETEVVAALLRGFRGDVGRRAALAHLAVEVIAKVLGLVPGHVGDRGRTKAIGYARLPETALAPDAPLSLPYKETSDERGFWDDYVSRVRKGLRLLKVSHASEPRGTP
jgi:hypothetical protein